MQHPNKKGKPFTLLARYITLSLFITQFYSCISKKSPEFNFVGRWKTDREATIAQMSTSKRSQYESQPAVVKQQFNAALDGRYYEFKQDGTVLFIISRNGKTNSFAGTWQYNADSGRLVTKSDVETKFTVSITSPDRIMLKNETAIEKSMLDDWVLQRINTN